MELFLRVTSTFKKCHNRFCISCFFSLLTTKFRIAHLNWILVFTLKYLSVLSDRVTDTTMYSVWTDLLRRIFDKCDSLTWFTALLFNYNYVSFNNTGTHYISFFLHFRFYQYWNWSGNSLLFHWVTSDWRATPSSAS